IKSNIIFLSENLVDANRIDSLRVDIKYDWCFMMDRMGRGRGLAVFWKNLELVSLLGYSNNHVDMSVVGVDKFKWRFTCFYGFPERHKRRESWNLLRALSCRSTLPWVCIGDYNDLLWGFILGFREAIMDCKSRDLPLIGYPYTWGKGCGTNIWVYERLDRAMCMDN
ncbi:hypothetical protein BDE02_06G046900, partial [Populus trichocarpa]